METITDAIKEKREEVVFLIGRPVKTPVDILEPIIRGLVYKGREPELETEKHLTRYFELVTTACYDTCFVCGCDFCCKDNPRVCLSHNLEMYVCDDCFKREKEFLMFIRNIVW